MSSSLGQKRKGRAKKVVSLAGIERKVHSLWLDSGAHSLYMKHCFRDVIIDGKLSRVLKPINERYKWYSKDGKNLSKAYIAYMDAFADFIREHGKGIDYYATVDTIYQPELSWRALMYLVKEQKLKPVPVIHHRTPLSYLDRHLNAGFNYIGLGGLGQESNKADYHRWADQVYAHLCQGSNNLPCVRTHGFAMTSFELMSRYPWWSVDSTSVFKCAANGSIYVPHMRNGEFTFDVDPYVIGFSHRSSAQAKGKHYKTLSKGEQAVLRKWLKEIGMKIGTVTEINGQDEMDEIGVYSSYNARVVANLRFFEKLIAHLPKWPWAFKIKPRMGFFQ